MNNEIQPTYNDTNTDSRGSISNIDSAGRESVDPGSTCTKSQVSTSGHINSTNKNIEDIQRNILKYELSPINITQFNTFYLKDITSVLNGSSILQFSINRSAIIKSGHGFLRLFTGDIDIDTNSFSLFTCTCINNSIVDYRGIGQCPCSSDSSNFIIPHVINKGSGTDSYLEIFLSQIQDTINNSIITLKLRIDYLMKGQRIVKMS